MLCPEDGLKLKGSFSFSSCMFFRIKFAGTLFVDMSI
jgi:hypothetical protein